MLRSSVQGGWIASQKQGWPLVRLSRPAIYYLFESTAGNRSTALLTLAGTLQSNDYCIQHLSPGAVPTPPHPCRKAASASVPSAFDDA